MKRQVITSWKCSWTMLTLKGFCSCMFSHMSCELIWTSKPPSTSIPGATIRFFAYVIITNFEEEYLDKQIQFYIHITYSVYLHIFSLPVCVRQWAFRWELFVYTLLQPGKLHLCVLLCSFCELSGNAFGTLSCSGLYLYIVPLIFGLTAGAWNVKCHIYVMLDMKGIGYRKLNFNVR